MRLRVKNLGPVREAELDLGKPLIVLTGPNNSGKTYLTWAAYSLARLDEALVETPPALDAWVNRLFESEVQALDVDSLLGVSDDIVRAMASAVRSSLPGVFAAPLERFARTEVELFPDEGEKQRLFAGKRHPRAGERLGERLLIFLGVESGRVRITALERTLDKTRPNERPITGLPDEELSSAKESAATLAKRLVMRALLSQPSVVFPVERLAINLFARELAADRMKLVDELLIDAAEAIDSDVIRDKLQERARRYPLVIRDALQMAIRVSAKAADGPLAELAEELEAEVLGGAIRLNAQDEPQFIPHQDPNKVPLGLHESASVVKSLVSLVLYLRHEAQPGQRLVIDEPELNLHPDNQRRVTRILAKAINRGLKIMMSTHSDYVIRELNNLVMLGQNSDEARVVMQELGYQPEQTLKRHQIGAYLVNNGACTPLEITETGFESETIENEIHKLNHDAQAIYLRLFSE